MSRIPHPPHRIPLVGDVLTVTRSNPVQAEAAMFRTLGVDVYERKVGPDRLLMVGGAAAANQVCDETTWSRALVGPASALRGFVPNGMFTARNSDPMWRAARSVLDPAFNRDAMMAYHGTMAAVADELVERWIAAGTVRSVTDECTRLTIEVIGRVGFGRSLGMWRSGSLRADPMYAALSDALQWGSDEANSIPILDLPRRLAGRGVVERAATALFEFARESIEAVRNGTAGADSLLGRMLTAPDDSGALLPEDVVAQQVITFLIAGHETTAGLLSTAVHYLARDPGLRETLRAEIEEVTAGDSDWDYPMVARMRGVQSVIQECLRFRPPAPAFFRIAREDTGVDGFAVPKGTVAMVVVLAAHRDPRVWGENAEEFDGLRFRASTPRGAFYKPWGTGPRSCIGRQFAQHEAALTLARLIARAEVTAVDRDSAEPVMQERGFMRPRDHGVVVRER